MMGQGTMGQKTTRRTATGIRTADTSAVSRRSAIAVAEGIRWSEATRDAGPIFAGNLEENVNSTVGQDCNGAR